MMARRAMRRRSVVGAAVAVSAVSSARRNRAERQAIEQQTDMNNQAVNQGYDDSAQAAPQDDLTAQLQQLDNLRKQGILTEEEFAAKKKQLLGI